jgi:hypothetical protein
MRDPSEVRGGAGARASVHEHCGHAAMHRRCGGRCGDVSSAATPEWSGYGLTPGKYISAAKEAQTTSGRQEKVCGLDVNSVRSGIKRVVWAGRWRNGCILGPGDAVLNYAVAWRHTSWTSYKRAKWAYQTLSAERTAYGPQEIGAEGFDSCIRPGERTYGWESKTTRLESRVTQRCAASISLQAKEAHRNATRFGHL